jgi:hypothetical protein
MYMRGCTQAHVREAARWVPAGNPRPAHLVKQQCRSNLSGCAKVNKRRVRKRTKRRVAQTFASFGAAIFWPCVRCATTVGCKLLCSDLCVTVLALVTCTQVHSELLAKHGQLTCLQPPLPGLCPAGRVWRAELKARCVRLTRPVVFVLIHCIT